MREMSWMERAWPWYTVAMCSAAPHKPGERQAAAQPYDQSPALTLASPPVSSHHVGHGAAGLCYCGHALACLPACLTRGPSSCLDPVPLHRRHQPQRQGTHLEHGPPQGWRRYIEMKSSGHGEGGGHQVRIGTNGLWGRS